MVGRESGRLNGTIHLRWVAKSIWLPSNRRTNRRKFTSDRASCSADPADAKTPEARGWLESRMVPAKAGTVRRSVPAKVGIRWSRVGRKLDRRSRAPGASSGCLSRAVFWAKARDTRERTKYLERELGIVGSNRVDSGRDYGTADRPRKNAEGWPAK